MSPSTILQSRVLRMLTMSSIAEKAVFGSGQWTLTVMDQILPAQVEFCSSAVIFTAYLSTSVRGSVFLCYEGEHVCYVSPEADWEPGSLQFKLTVNDVVAV